MCVLQNLPQVSGLSYVLNYRDIIFQSFKKELKLSLVKTVYELGNEADVAGQQFAVRGVSPGGAMSVLTVLSSPQALCRHLSIFLPFQHLLTFHGVVSAGLRVGELLEPAASWPWAPSCALNRQL